VQSGYLRFLMRPDKLDRCGLHCSKRSVLSAIGEHVIAAKTRKQLITERRRSKRNARRVCRCRATTNTLHSDRTETETVTAATASTAATDNREVGRRAAAAAVSTHWKRGRSGARAHTNVVYGTRGPVTSERDEEVRVQGCRNGWWSPTARRGECGGRSRHTLGRSAGWRATDSVLPTARRQNTGHSACVRPTDSLHIILLLLLLLP